VKTRAEKKNSDSETHTQALTNRERSLRILGAVTKTGRRLHGGKKPATPEQSGRHQRLAEAKTGTLTQDEDRPDLAATQKENENSTKMR
jgi:hypothetical protein